MAAVWSVHDDVTGKKLALKRLSESANQRHVALFEREYHTLASLHHPCIVNAYDYAADEHGPFYTMELLDGSDVSKLVPQPWMETCKILRDVASGLALLHARRLIHRDLSARNVWLTADGRVKVIDFGTMAAFGRATDIAGTPPFIAPESVHGSHLDQRTDLYGLGALAYYLLTGRQAFPARSLAELESIWRTRPRPASRRVSELGRADLPEVPLALDALVDSLLSGDPLARPTNAADVIDRLTVIASLEPIEQSHVAQSYLSRPAFIGRTAERGTLRGLFDGATLGCGACVTVESPQGLGRTRFLTESSLEARLAGGGIVLQAEAQPGAATHEVALKYALRLLDALPAEALELAAPYANTLGHLSPALRVRLGVAPENLVTMPKAHGEARMRVQAALLDWFLDVTREHLVVILADDFDAFDEGSAAWLSALGRQADERKLLVVTALRTDRAPFGIAVQALRQVSTRVPLEALSRAETAELFRSIFGDAQHLGRLVDLLHQRAEGNPSHAMDLAEHLNRNGVIAFAEGAWVLPQTIDVEALPRSRQDAEMARFAHLAPHARALGQTLGVREGAIPVDMCAGLAEIEGQLLFDGLEALVREGILVGSADGYRFSRESLRTALHAELDEHRRRRAHLRLGQWLLASQNLSELDRLKAGVHLLVGGDEEGGSRAVAIAGRHYGLVDLADLGPAVPALELALEHFRAARRPPHELVSLLSPLALAGYYADRRLATRYGEQAVETLESVVGLKTARRLSRVLGRKFGLLLALALAALTFAMKAKNPRVPKFRDAMMLLFNCVTALTGVATICIDPARGKKYASVLEPMTALGPGHVASFMHRFCLNLVATVEDRVGEARANWMEMLERLESPEAVANFPENVYSLYLGGALYARGVAECWRDDSRALECAERLDALKLKLYDMSADQVRMMYHANRGNLEQFDLYRERVEVHAIQRGTAWQVETWTFSGLVTVYARTRDARRLKECVEQLKRLSAEMPSLKYAYRRALGAYLLLRGTPTDALEVLGQGERPLELVGWGRGEGLRASAYNTLGEWARAKETCDRALALLTEEDLKCCALNLGLLIERSRAEASLGDVSGAEQQLHALLEQYEPAENPLTIGALHEALAELAVLRGDEAALSTHVRGVDRWFRGTRDPALVARVEHLSRIAASLVRRPVEDEGRRSSSRPPRVMTIVHRLRHGGDHTPSGSAEWAMKQLAEFAGVEEGYLFVPRDERYLCAASLGALSDVGALTAAVSASMAQLALGSEATTCLTESIGDPARIELGGRAYRLITLPPVDEQGGAETALLLPDGTSIPHVVLETISERLAATHAATIDGQ
jgi:tetratricopeptide (TPR) repeat protein